MRHSLSMRGATAGALASILMIVFVANACGGNDHTRYTTTTQALAIGFEASLLEHLPRVNDARNALIKLSEDRFAAWSGVGAPSDEHLVAKELEAFEEQAGALRGALLLADMATSSPLPALIENWIESLQQLVITEKNLVKTFSEANVEANFLAWEKEAAAYEPVLDYYNSHLLRFNPGSE